MYNEITRIFLLFTLAFFVISCDDDKEVCDDCQDAIDQMFHKIESNDCNPDSMESAVVLLKDECGLFSAQAFTGVMAHSCASEEFTRRPLCNSDDDDIILTSLYLNNVQIALDVLTTRDPDEIILVEILNGNGAGGEEGAFQLQEGDHADHFIETLSNGATVEIVVSNMETKEILIQKPVLNRFWRSGYWNEIRTAQVQYLPLSKEYDVVFSYW